MPVTDQSLTRKVRQLCALGYQCYDKKDFKKALRLFYQAWLLIPKPQTDWREAGWVLAAIGDSYFCSAQYLPASEALQSSLRCPMMDKIPFIHLRLGQSWWELGEHDKARASLLRAYEIGNIDIFSTEARKYYFAIAGLLVRKELRRDASNIQHHKRFHAVSD